MKRGEVWWVNFDPSVGGEIRKQRPAVIISNYSANRFLNRVQVVPMSSQMGVRASSGWVNPKNSIMRETMQPQMACPHSANNRPRSRRRIG